MIKFVLKFMVCKVHHFEAQYALRLRSPLRMLEHCFKNWLNRPLLLESEPLDPPQLKESLVNKTLVMWPQPCILYQMICAILHQSVVTIIASLVTKSKRFGHPKKCCNYPKILTMWFYHTWIHPNDADRMANGVDLDQTAPSVSGPGHAKMCLMPYANNKGVDQPAYPHSLISTFVVRCLDSMICILAISKVSRF